VQGRLPLQFIGPSGGTHNLLSAAAHHPVVCTGVKDFPDQLVRASCTAGTMLDVALVLGVEPTQVYRWIAGVDLPNEKRIDELNAQLSLLFSI